MPNGLSCSYFDLMSTIWLLVSHMIDFQYGKFYIIEMKKFLLMAHREKEKT